jgi:hypothetical protein
MKEIIKLSLYMVSSNLSFSSTPGGPISRVLKSLESPFLLSLWSPALLLAALFFLLLIPSTVLFPYIVPLMKQRDQGPDQRSNYTNA